MSKKICIFPNDPLQAYFDKGELKERYYNPDNFFDEIHFISFIEQDIEVEKIQKIAGRAKVKIHSVGKISIRKRKKYLDSILDLVTKINPDVIRAYNPLLEGWFAANCAKELKIPLFVSLHTQYDENRKISKKNNLKKFLALKYTEKIIEPFVLKNADRITGVYKIIEPYVKKHTSKKMELLYNKVDCKKFQSGSKIDELPNPLILSVGNLTVLKNHALLIDAMQNIDANLLIIGNGEQFSELNIMIDKLNLENKIKIIKSVPHDKIQNYFKSATIFALAFNPEIESLPMPVMEAMATGLPIVIPYPKKGFSEGLENVVLFSERNSIDFSKNIQKILKDSELTKILSIKSLEKSIEYDSYKNEIKEAKIYQELIKLKK